MTDNGWTKKQTRVVNKIKLQGSVKVPFGAKLLHYAREDHAFYAWYESTQEAVDDIEQYYQTVACCVLVQPYAKQVVLPDGDYSHVHTHVEEHLAFHLYLWGHTLPQ